MVRYEAEVREKLGPYLNSVYDDPAQVDNEINEVSRILVSAAEKTLPSKGKMRRKITWYRDDDLKSVYAQSKEARKAWKEVGCPTEGDLFERKAKMRRAVRSRVRVCAAMEERRRIQRREKLFQQGARASHRFRFSQQKRDKCSKLLKDGELVTERGTLLEMWADILGIWQCLILMTCVVHERK